MSPAAAVEDIQLYRSANKAREVADRRERERRRALVVLTLRFLADSGYTEACQALSAATGVSLIKVDAADNVDLLRILTEWEESQEIRWGRRPKLMVERSSSGGGSVPNVSVRTDGGRGTSPAFSGQMAARQRRDRGAAATAAAAAAGDASKASKAGTAKQPPPAASAAAAAGGAPSDDTGCSTEDSLAAFAVEGRSWGQQQFGLSLGGGADAAGEEGNAVANRLLKPLPVRFSR